KPDDARAYYDKEKALLHLNRYKEAAAVYDQVIALKPDDARAYYAKGKALLRLQYHEGRYYFYTRKANHVLPAAVLQRFEEALNAFNKVIELYPAEASSAATNNQRKTFPRKKPADLYANAYQANASNDKEEALLDKQPDDLCADAYYYIGEILLRLHRYKETLAICDRAIKRNLQSAGTYSNIGKALYALHRYQEALDVFRQYGSSDSEAGAAKSTIFWQMAFRWGWRFSLFEALTIGGTFLLAYTFGHLGSWPWPSFVWEVVAFWLLLLVCGFLAGRQTGEEGLGSIAALGAGLFWAFVFAVAQSIVLHITNDDPIWEFHTVFDYIWFFLFEGVLVFVGVFLGFVGNAIGVGRHRRANTADVLAGEADFPPP
ncbi:MAG TPA: tetratricopeptide repeat protein, partial [Ktedonobacterales bacterium]|nr:tetratricopeptide repeat protein [Ktedonobacterales bacterium]